VLVGSREPITRLVLQRAAGRPFQNSIFNPPMKRVFISDMSNKPPLTRDKLQPTAQELWWSRRLLTPLGRAHSIGASRARRDADDFHYFALRFVAHSSVMATVAPNMESSSRALSWSMVHLADSARTFICALSHRHIPAARVRTLPSMTADALFDRVVGRLPMRYQPPAHNNCGLKSREETSGRRINRRRITALGIRN
jgi:hypothetical protein